MVDEFIRRSYLDLPVVTAIRRRHYLCAESKMVFPRTCAGNKEIAQPNFILTNSDAPCAIEGHLSRSISVHDQVEGIRCGHNCHVDHVPGIDVTLVNLSQRRG